MYAAIGAMAMPLDFKYKRVLQRGRPKHNKYDDFYRKHPPMDRVRWAKIFAPFDALDGFDEAVGAKLVQYEERHDLSECEKEERTDLTKLWAQSWCSTRNVMIYRSVRRKSSIRNCLISIP